MPVLGYMRYFDLLIVEFNYHVDFYMWFVSFAIMLDPLLLTTNLDQLTTFPPIRIEHTTSHKSCQRISAFPLLIYQPIKSHNYTFLTSEWDEIFIQKAG